MRLAKDVLARSGQRLLAAGKNPCSTIIEGLRQHFIFEIEVFIPSTDTFESQQDLVVQVQATADYLEDLMAKG